MKLRTRYLRTLSVVIGLVCASGILGVYTDRKVSAEFELL